MMIGCWVLVAAGQWSAGERKENGDDVVFKTHLSSHHIGIGTKL